VARYKVEGGNMRDGGRVGSVWWNQMVGLRRGYIMVVDM